MATIKEQDIVLVSKEPDGTKVIQMPITRVENVEGGIATVNGIKPDSSKNISISKVSNASNADNATQATKAFQDGNGKIITDTYATKTELSTKLDSNKAFTKATADTLYLGKKDKAVSASSADTAATCSGNSATATKATQDASGNVITTTYSTKGEMNTVSQTASNALNTANAKINSGGNRGAIAGYESVSSSNVVNATSPDTQRFGGDVTVQPGSSDQVWTKVVYMWSGNVHLGAGWVWANNKAPTIKHPCLLVCHWSADVGIANVINGAS